MAPAALPALGVERDRGGGKVERKLDSRLTPLLPARLAKARGRLSTVRKEGGNDAMNRSQRTRQTGVAEAAAA